VSVFILLFGAFVFAQESQPAKAPGDPVEYLGSFDPALVPAIKDLYMTGFQPVADTGKYKFAEQMEKPVSIFAGTLYDPRKSGGRLNVLMVEPKKGDTYFCADLNANGTIEENERASATALAGETGPGYILDLPISTPLYKKYPIFLTYRPDLRGSPEKPGERVVQFSAYAFAQGHVDIQGRSVLVQYWFHGGGGPVSLSATDGQMGIDVNGDGKISGEPFSVETSYAAKTEIVFRLGDKYLSTSRFDLQNNRIIMRPRLASEYQRHELEPGKEMQNFSFVDFADKKRSLSDFRGKYLLVDFWGMWCVDCRHEIPFLTAAYKKFRSRGFEILGMNDDKNTAEIIPKLKDAGIDWPQARQDSIKDIAVTTYAIQEYPTVLLLGPDGKVLILDQKQLSGEQLGATLDKILPR
jgi:thiol-disulfide isomerase/thioredoxin